MTAEPSKTALGTAYLRAFHQTGDGPEVILADPVAEAFLGPQTKRLLESRRDRYETKGARALRSHVAVRSRCAEDCLEEAVRGGVRQYVILGAGLDTFAWRQPAWADQLTIVELDHPATQAFKKQRAGESGLPLPANLVWAPIDFEVEALADVLGRTGLNPQIPTFVSWLGVTMYLERAAIEATLKTLSQWFSPCGLVLTFLQPPEPGREGLSHRVDDLGEPFRTYFTPSSLEETLRHNGFPQVEILSPSEIQARYFQGATTLPPPRRASLARAWSGLVSHGTETPEE